MSGRAIETTGSTKKKLLIVDNHPILRRGLAALVESEPDLAICGGVGTRAAAVEAIRQKQPHLVIVELALSDEDGLDLVREINTRYPRVHSLVFSTHDEALYAERALGAGAMGYVSKKDVEEIVLGAIRRALAGERYMSETLQRRLAERYIAGGGSLETDSPLHKLSDRELQVFRLIGQGRTTRQIADALARSVKTIESHIEHLKNKLGLQYSPELARCATLWVETGRIG